MDSYALQGSAFLHPTPAGAFVAVSHPDRDPAGSFLLRLLRQPQTPTLTSALLQEWTGLGEHDALAFLWQLQESGLVQGLPEELSAPAAATDSWLPAALSSLSLESRALLADPQGLVLGSSGYSPDAAQELAALGADVMALHARHAGLLERHFRLGRAGWGVVAPAGYSELGCWPLQVGSLKFMLVIHGEPRLNQQAFTQLVWALGVHYAR